MLPRSRASASHRGEGYRGSARRPSPVRRRRRQTSEFSPAFSRSSWDSSGHARHGPHNRGVAGRRTLIEKHFPIDGHIECSHLGRLIIPEEELPPDVIPAFHFSNGDLPMDGPH